MPLVTSTEPQAYPRLPVLGWSSCSGPRAARLPGVLDAPHRSHTVSGRAAIGLALRLLGIGAGSRVLVPTYHCPTMVSPVVRAGAQPVFYPIGADAMPDPGWLEAQPPGPRALLAVHYFGIPASLAGLRTFCDRRGIFLIEDCAHAFFGVAGERAVGGWGDFAIASLTKFFPVPEGGLLVSTTRALDGLDLAPRRWLEQVKAAIDAVETGARYRRFAGLNLLLSALFGAKRSLYGARRTGPIASPAHATNTVANALADPLLAEKRIAAAARCLADGMPQGRIVERRRSNYAALARQFAGCAGARPLRPELPEGAAPYVFPLYVDEPDRSYQAVRATGIPIFRWDDMWPDVPRIAGDHGLLWARHVYQIGCHQDLSRADINVIAATVREIVSA